LGPCGALVLLCLCLATRPVNLGGQRQQGTDVVNNAAITGVVLNSESSRPVPEVRVELIDRGVSAAVVSDIRGRFAFVGLAPSEYLLRATKPGFSNGQYAVGLMGASGGRVVVSAGDWVKEVAIQVEPLGVISGTLRLDTGEVVPGAAVEAIRSVQVGGRPLWAAGPVAVSDDRGQYRISGLKKGRYVLAVPNPRHSGPDLHDVGPASVQRGQGARSGGPPTSQALSVMSVLAGSLDGRVYPFTFAPGVDRVVGADVLELSAGAELVGRDITLHAVPARVVSGRVSGATSGVTGEIVRLMPTGLDYLGAGNEVATTRVRPDGTFEFRAVPDGDYVLMSPGRYSEPFVASSMARPPETEATLPGGAAAPDRREIATFSMFAFDQDVAFRSYFPKRPGNAASSFARQALSVQSDLSLVDLRAESLVYIDGEAVVLGSDGESAYGAVQLSPADLDFSLGTYTARVDAKQVDAQQPIAFSIADVLPGTYALRITGLEGKTIRSVELDGQTISSHSLVVGDAGLRRLRIVVDDGGVLSGTITDQGQAASAASAVLFPVDKSLWTRFGYTPTWIRISTGRSDGRYQLARIRAGEYFLAAVEPQVAAQWFDPDVLESLVGSARRVTVGWGENRQINLSLSEAR